MTGLERTRAFLRGQPVDRPPFHPIIMRWAAKYAGVPYREFCLDYKKKCDAMIRAAEDFDIDWVTVMSDAYAEASAFGLKIEYPENDLPKAVGGLLADPESAARLKPYRTADHERTINRVNEILEFRRRGARHFILGWVEGPVAEYVDLRGAEPASLDLYDDPIAVGMAMDVITDCALDFSAQIEPGAHCVGIGDAFCSQIGPDLYRQFAFERERRMVEHIHRCGAIAKLHICGNTSSILPGMIETGADIIDVDHLVPFMTDFAELLNPTQAFSGKADPVSVIQFGSEPDIERAVRDSFMQSDGRCIVSAGCEIAPETSPDNLRALRNAADRL